MTFRDYLVSSKRLRHETARSRPLQFFLTETGRHAAVLALVLVVMDVTPFTFRGDSPWGRLLFIGLWSVVMAGLRLVRLRMRKIDARASSSG